MRPIHRGLMTLALLLLLMAPAVTAAAPQIDPAAPTIQVTYPSGATAIGEGYDYATSAWGDPWDMSSLSDVYYWGNPSCGNPSPNYTNVGIAGGVWHGQTAVTSPPLFLLQPGYQTGALVLARDGLNWPIDAGRYYRLTFRMRIDHAPPGSPGYGRILYSDGSFENQTDPAHWSSSRRFTLFADNNWHIYDLELRTMTPGDGSLAWTAGKWMTALAIVPEYTAGATVWIDWARLSDDSVSQRIAWTGSYAGSATVQLGLGNSADGYVPVHVFEPGHWNGYALEQTAIAASAGSYTLHGGLAAGSYTVRATVTDGTGTTTSNPAGPFNARGASWGTFTRPSFGAGVDWISSLPAPANPWDMDTGGGGDITGMTNVPFTEYVMSGSSNLFHGVTASSGALCVAGGDPQLILNGHWNLIDTNRFHWLTIRMWVEGTPDLAAGSVTRVSWWTADFLQCGESNDIVLRQGWNTYSINLSGNVIEPGSICQRTWQSQNWRHLRIDPVELPVATSFWIDYVLLTDDIVATTSVQLAWQQYLPNGSPVDLALYYDSDRNPANGKTLITTGRGDSASAAPPGRAPACTSPSCSYLPLIRNSMTQLLCSNGACSYMWNTAGVPTGNYYMYVESSDGYSTIGRYSETPVLVRH